MPVASCLPLRNSKAWIFDELVPETLKNGGYLLKKNGETDNELLARAILLAQNRIKERDSRISALEKENNYAILKLKLQAPKVQYYDKVLQSQSTYTTTQIAKELGMTAGMLNKRLRWAGIQFRQSGQWLLKGSLPESRLYSNPDPCMGKPHRRNRHGHVDGLDGKGPVIHTLSFEAYLV